VSNLGDASARELFVALQTGPAGSQASVANLGVFERSASLSATNFGHSGTTGTTGAATNFAISDYNSADYNFDYSAPVGTDLLTSEEADWHERALCAQTDPEAFFPEKGGSTREAKKICTGCEVRSECLTYALAHDERFGIWGGLSERERRRLKRSVG